MAPRQRSSTRFRPTGWTRWVVPSLLILLALGLLSTLVLTLLAVLGVLGG